MRLLIAGDYVPVGRFSNCIENNDYDFGIIKSYCEKADLSIVNFEAPIITGDARRIFKNGPCLYVTQCAVEGIKRCGFNAVTLANNHFRDYGDNGVETTLKTLESYGIDYVGGGMNLSEASKILYKKKNDEVVAIVNFCESEFSIATANRGGSMPLNIIHNYHQVMEAKRNAQYIIAIVHGGHEDYQLPSPRMKELYRFFIDIGVDAVINHHQHCYSGYEVYKGKPIFYGLGNFIFDRAGKRRCRWNEGFFVTLNLEKESITFDISPYRQCDERPGAFLLDNQETEQFKESINKLNAVIADDVLLNKDFDRFIKGKSSGIKATFSVFDNRYIMALINRGFLPHFISKKKATMLYDYINCESHRDITLKAINQIFEKE